MNYIYLFNCPHTKCHHASCFGQAREYGRQSVRQLFGADAELSARVCCCCRVVFSRAVCCCTAPGVECAPGGVDGLPCCQARVWAGLLHGIVGGGCSRGGKGWFCFLQQSGRRSKLLLGVAAAAALLSQSPQSASQWPLCCTPTGCAAWSAASPDLESKTM